MKKYVGILMVGVWASSACAGFGLFPFGFGFFKPLPPAGVGGPTPDAAWLQTRDGSGTTAADSIGNKTGTLSGASIPTWVTGQDGVAGHALSFGGVTSWVSLANPPLIGNTNVCTLFLWFKKASGTIAATQVIYGEGRSSDTTPFVLLGFDTSGHIVAQIRTDASVASTLVTTTNYNDNVWHTATIILESKNSMKLYVGTAGGIEYAGQDTSSRGTTTIDQCSIGSLNRTVNALFYSGTMADLKFYVGAKTSNDVVNLTAQGTP